MSWAARAAFAAMLAAAAPAQTISLGATLPPGGIVFGDAFEVVVERSFPSGFEPPAFDESTLAPLVVERIDREAGVGPGKDRHACRVRCFAVGEVKLGPLVMKGAGGAVATSGQLVLHVRSSLPDPAGGFEWPGDVRELHARSWSWLFAALALLAGGVLWWRRSARSAPAPVVAGPIAAPPTALHDLRALVVPDERADAATVAAFHATVKRLVRVHCSERFGVAADVHTSEELRRRLPSSASLDACLSACDLVLFAAMRPPVPARATALAAAIGFAAEEAA